MQTGEVNGKYKYLYYFLNQFLSFKYIGIYFVIISTFVVIFIPIYHDLYRHLPGHLDPELGLIYEALSFNEGEIFRFNPHGAFNQLVLLAQWFKFLNWMGVLEIFTVQPLVETKNFEVAYAQIVGAARILSVIYSLSLLGVVFGITLTLSRNAASAGLAMFVVASGFGMQTQYTNVRSELPAMLFVLLSAWMLILAVRRVGYRSTLYTGLAAAAAMVAAMFKLQAIIVLVFVPPLALCLALGVRGRKEPSEPTNMALMGLIIFALLFGREAAAQWWEALNIGPFKLYEIGIPIYIAGSMVLYALVSRTSLKWTAVAAVAVTSGLSLSFYFVFVGYVWWEPFALVNFIEFMSFDITEVKETNSLTTWVKFLLDITMQNLDFFYLTDNITNKVYVFQFNYILALIMAFWFLKIKKYNLLFLSLYLVLVATLIPILFGARGYRFYYYIFAEPWIAIALGVGVSQWLVKSITFSPLRASPIAIIVFAGTLVVGAYQVRYRALAPSTANSTDISHICCFVPYAKRIAHHIAPICHTTNRTCHINWPEILEREELLRQK